MPTGLMKKRAVYWDRSAKPIDGAAVRRAWVLILIAIIWMVISGCVWIASTK